MISYRVDYSNEAGEIKTECFDDDRGAAMSRAQKASKLFGMAYMIRSQCNGEGPVIGRTFSDTGALGFAGGRIDTREGVTQ